MEQNRKTEYIVIHKTTDLNSIYSEASGKVLGEIKEF